MDFGEILDKWESIEKSSSKKNTSKSYNDSKLKSNNTFYSNISKKKPNADFIERQYNEEVKISSKENATKSSPFPNNNINQSLQNWLDTYGVLDKDKVLARYNHTKKLYSSEYVSKLPIDATLDLHGLTREQAWCRMESFVLDCTRAGFKKIMFIHGKGIHTHDQDPVLQGTLKLFIEKNKTLGASGHPDKNLGGTGATWVLIKKNNT